MEHTVKETTPGPQVTIVIGTLNRPQVVMHLVSQLVEESKRIPLELFVIDQSDETTFKNLDISFPKLPNFYLLHQEEKNICKYLNAGWRSAKAPVILFLDDDVEITPQTISSHLSLYKEGFVQGVAGRVLNDGEDATIDSQVGSIKWFGAIMTMNFSFNKQTTVSFPYGCNMSFRKSILQELNGFDEKLTSPGFAYMEVDLGYRLNKKYPNAHIFSSDALVYHHKHKTGGTRNDYSPKQVFQSNQFNYGYFLGKNFNWIENGICFLRRLPYQLTKEPKAIPHILKGFLFAKKQHFV